MDLFMETDGRFSYTLDGFFEAKEYLRKNNWLDKVERRHFKGIQLIETANRLYKMILDSH